MARVIKNPPAYSGNVRLGFDAWIGKVPWRRKWQPIPVVLPGKFHGQRRIVGCTVHGVAKGQT